MQTLTLRLPMPPSVNRAYANRKSGEGRGRVATKALRSWKSAARSSVAIALVGVTHRPVFVGRVDVSIHLPVPTGGARRDGDNVVKPTLDLLVACGVIADDNWRYVRRSSVEWVDDGIEGEAEVILSLVSEMPAGKATRPRTAAKSGAPVGRDRRPSPKAPSEASDAAAIRAIAAKLGVSPERVHLTGGGALRTFRNPAIARPGRPEALLELSRKLAHQ